jgi:hypothetical protein
MFGWLLTGMFPWSASFHKLFKKKCRQTPLTVTLFCKEQMVEMLATSDRENVLKKRFRYFVLVLHFVHM